MERHPRLARFATELVNKRFLFRDSTCLHPARPVAEWAPCCKRARSVIPVEEWVVSVYTKLWTFMFLQVKKYGADRRDFNECKKKFGLER